MAFTIQLFITCLVDTLYPQVGEAVVRVFQRLGGQVIFPKNQTCCGQPAFNAGERKPARDMAAHMIRCFEAQPHPVVTPSGSCAAMLRHSYLELFAGEPEWLERARALAQRTYEFSEYLVDVLGVSDVGAQFAGPVAYHASCHLLRSLGVDRQPRWLLEHVWDGRSAAPLEVRSLPGGPECCGFGGVFSVEHARVSGSMLERKLAALQASQAPTLVACDAGCITHISGGLQRRRQPQRVLHLAQVLNSRQEE